MTTVLPLGAFGNAIAQVTVPPVPGLAGYLQTITLDPALNLDASNGLQVQNDF